MNNEMTRREVIKKSLGVVGISIGASLLYTSCQKSCSSEQQSFSPNKEADLPESCPDPYELTADDKAARSALRYVDKTPIDGRTCDNCKLYTRPKLNDVCGGCSILKGPIHPKGYCMSWIKQM